MDCLAVLFTGLLKVSLSLSLSFSTVLGLNSGLHACQAGALVLEPLLQPKAVFSQYGVELRALRPGQVCYHLNPATSPFCFNVFQVRS
jgi:hypothetical protein